jgi:hypothetical protein
MACCKGIDMLKSLTLPLILLGAGVALSGCVTSNADGIRQIKNHRFAVSGERTEIGRDWSLNPDCTLRGNPSVRVLQAPKHGKLAIVREDVFPYWKNGKCNSKKVVGNAQYYTSDRGFTGTDSATTRHSYANGFVQDVTAEIKVVK